MYYCYFDTPIGELLLAGDNDALEIIGFPEGSMRRDPEQDWIFNEQPFEEACRQLGEYFKGKRREFDLPLKLGGTDFQVEVLEELKKIPYGETTSYAAIAERIGRPKAVRAVGAANGRNPIPIIVPCHRVIGKGGDLTGFGGGLDTKEGAAASRGRAQRRPALSQSQKRLPSSALTTGDGSTPSIRRSASTSDV